MFKTEEDYEMYEQQAKSRAFKINELNKRIAAQKDLILRLKNKEKIMRETLEWYTGYSLECINKKARNALEKIKGM